jgi:hypothetical protein
VGAVRLGPGSRGGRVLVALALARDYLGVDSNKTSSSRTRKINRAEPEEPTHDWESVSWRHEWIQLLSRHVLGPVCETYGRSTLSRHGPRPRRPRVEAIVRYLASVCGAIEKNTGHVCYHKTPGQGGFSEAHLWCFGVTNENTAYSTPYQSQWLNPVLRNYGFREGRNHHPLRVRLRFFLFILHSTQHGQAHELEWRLKQR